MQGQQLTAQQLYDAFYVDAYDKADASGMKPPKEDVVFDAFVKVCRKMVRLGHAPPDFMDEVKEVKAMKARMVLEQLQAQEAELMARKDKIIVPVSQPGKIIKH